MRRIFTVLSAFSVVVCVTMTLVSLADCWRIRHETERAISTVNADLSGQIKKMDIAFRETYPLAESRPSTPTAVIASLEAHTAQLNDLAAEQDRLTTELIRLRALTFSPPAGYLMTIALSAVPPTAWLLSWIWILQRQINRITAGLHSTERAAIKREVSAKLRQTSQIRIAVTVAALVVLALEETAVTLFRDFTGRPRMALAMWISLAIGVLSGWAFILPARSRELRRILRSRGFCVLCGYDIHASTDCCPECGEPIEREPQATVPLKSN